MFRERTTANGLGKKLGWGQTKEFGFFLMTKGHKSILNPGNMAFPYKKDTSSSKENRMR